MFTGIIEAVREIKYTHSFVSVVYWNIWPGMLALCDFKFGDSIAVTVVCLTVTTLANGMFSVDVSRETLSCTEGLDKEQDGSISSEPCDYPTELVAIW